MHQIDGFFGRSRRGDPVTTAAQKFAQDGQDHHFVVDHQDFVRGRYHRGRSARGCVRNQAGVEILGWRWNTASGLFHEPESGQGFHQLPSRKLRAPTRARGRHHAAQVGQHSPSQVGANPAVDRRRQTLRSGRGVHRYHRGPGGPVARLTQAKFNPLGGANTHHDDIWLALRRRGSYHVGQLGIAQHGHRGSRLAGFKHRGQGAF